MRIESLIAYLWQSTGARTDIEKSSQTVYKVFNFIYRKVSSIITCKFLFQPKKNVCFTEL